METIYFSIGFFIGIIYFFINYLNSIYKITTDTVFSVLKCKKCIIDYIILLIIVSEIVIIWPIIILFLLIMYFISIKEKDKLK